MAVTQAPAINHKTRTEAPAAKHRRHEWRPTPNILRTTDTAARSLVCALLAANPIATSLGYIWAYENVASENGVSEGKSDTATRAAEQRISDGGLDSALGREVVIAGYSGVPVTTSSDVSVSNPGSDEFIVKGVDWIGRPFKSPIYYGVRVIDWGKSGRVGGMLDFTHSKTISNPDQTVSADGTAAEENLSGPVKLGKLFKRLEFSHGHNMLTFNGVMRLGRLAPNLSPYVGFGVGVNLPHSEVQLATDEKRTYKYQYTGPVAQALVGFEFRLPRATFFAEYKFSFADYTVPISQLQDTDIGLFGDLWVQAGAFWRGEGPLSGTLETNLVSHNFIAGAGVRLPLGR